jgi:hypothetical protein
MTNWNYSQGSGRGLIEGNIQEFGLSDWRNQRKSSVRITGLRADI